MRKEYRQKCESGTKIVPCGIIYTGKNFPSRYFLNFCVKMVGIWYLFFLKRGRYLVGILIFLVGIG